MGWHQREGADCPCCGSSHAATLRTLDFAHRCKPIEVASRGDSSDRKHIASREVSQPCNSARKPRITAAARSRRGLTECGVVTTCGLDRCTSTRATRPRRLLRCALNRLESIPEVRCSCFERGFGFQARIYELEEQLEQLQRRYDGETFILFARAGLAWLSGALPL